MPGTAFFVFSLDAAKTYVAIHHMGWESNNASNQGRYAPTDADRMRMKRDHRLSWHVRGGWSRTFPGDKGRTYFGRVPPDEAIKRLAVEEDRRAAGRERVRKKADLPIREAVKMFWDHLDEQLARGDIGFHQRASYGRQLKLFVKQVGDGVRLSDLCGMDAPESIFRPARKAAMARGVFAGEKHIVQVRSFLTWCSDVRRMTPAPFYANEFDPPSMKEKRHVRKGRRKEKGEAFWTAVEIRQIVQAAKDSGVHRYAQILLMLNGGMGSTDLSNLTDADVDWPRRCIRTDRSKTLVPRVVPLWDETLQAMKASRAVRPEPADPDDAGRFFMTQKGKPLVIERLDESRTKNLRTDSLRNWFYRLFNAPHRTRWKEKSIRLHHLKRDRAGGYTLRSVFATLSLGHGGDRNLEAIILGQQFDRPILEHYVRDEQMNKLRAIVDHVRSQIWP